VHRRFLRLPAGTDRLRWLLHPGRLELLPQRQQLPADPKVLRHQRHRLLPAGQGVLLRGAIGLLLLIRLSIDAIGVGQKSADHLHQLVSERAAAVVVSRRDLRAATPTSLPQSLDISDSRRLNALQGLLAKLVMQLDVDKAYTQTSDDGRVIKPEWIREGTELSPQLQGLIKSADPS
jgi:hypothetical protein